MIDRLSHAGVWVLDQDEALEFYTRELGFEKFATADCRAAYEQLSGRGVKFLQEPTERPYGLEATFRDNSGNWFSLTQHTEDSP